MFTGLKTLVPSPKFMRFLLVTGVTIQITLILILSNYLQLGPEVFGQEWYLESSQETPFCVSSSE